MHSIATGRVSAPSLVTFVNERVVLGSVARSLQEVRYVLLQPSRATIRRKLPGTGEADQRLGGVQCAMR